MSAIESCSLVLSVLSKPPSRVVFLFTKFKGICCVKRFSCFAVEYGSVPSPEAAILGICDDLCALDNVGGVLFLVVLDISDFRRTRFKFSSIRDGCFSIFLFWSDGKTCFFIFVLEVLRVTLAGFFSVTYDTYPTPSTISCGDIGYSTILLN